MDELTAWSRDLTVEVGGHGVVSHTGSAALRLLADRTGLTGALSRALRRRGFTPVHDRGRGLVDTAVCIADARVLSDLATCATNSATGPPTCGSSAAANAPRPVCNCAPWRKRTAGATTSGFRGIRHA